MLLSSVVVLAATGCSTGIVLTDRGARVHDVSPTDVPGGCTMLGDVSIGIPPDAARPRTEEQLVILMRNRAAESGATHVMVESRERRGTGVDEHYSGRARGYRCPDEEPAAPSAAPAAAPEEEPAPADEESPPEE
jgi:hypothetical protein